MARAAVAVVPVHADLVRQRIHPAVEVAAFLHRQAVRAAIALFKLGDLAEFAAQVHRLTPAERAVANALVDAAFDLRLALVDRLPRLGGGGQRGHGDAEAGEHQCE